MSIDLDKAITKASKDTSIVFKPGARQPARAWFLEMSFTA